MKTLLWKEVRENLKWAFLIVVVLCGAEFHALLDRGNQDGLVPLMKPSFLMATTWGCAAAGLLLGLAQILPELGRDRWAGLLHRPVSRSTILWSKIFAGLSLYFVAALIPFLLCVWYVATPGHYPILFTPGFLKPGLVDIAGGAMCYCAGLFIGLRGGRWQSSRVLGLGAILITASASTTANVSSACIVIGLATFVFLVAAFGAMRTDGTFGRQPMICRICLAAIYVLPLFGGVAMAINFLGSMMDIRPRAYSQYRMLNDGRPVICRNTDYSEEWTDLAGHPLTVSWLKGQDSGAQFLNFQSLSTTGWGNGNRHPHTPYVNYRSPDSQALSLRADGSPGETWVFMEKERVVVGFSAREYPGRQTLIGTIGTDGFHPGSLRAKPFPGRWIGRDGGREYFQMDDQIFRFDSVHRQVQTIFAGGPIYGIGVIPSRSPHDLLVFLDLEKQILVMDKEGKTRATLPHHGRDLQQYGNISVARAEASDRYVVEYDPGILLRIDPLSKVPSYWEEMDAQGNLLNSYELPRLKQLYARQSDAELGLSLMPAALVGVFFSVCKIGALHGSEMLRYELAHIGRFIEELGWCLALVSLTLSLVALGWGRWRQLSWKSAIGWALFVLGFNLPGLIAFLLLADWPVLVECPRCGGLRDPRAFACRHCQERWPVAARDGTEIIEEKEKEPVSVVAW